MSLLTTDGTALLRGGRAHRILSGSLHYFRVHPDQWADRLQRLRALGLNTVDTYVAWNWHERRRGEYRFTGWGDVERFIRLAGETGLDVIVRPGPYICAEWDNGGLPVWLTGRPGIRLRCSDPHFVDAVETWFGQLLPRLAALQAGQGGPVVAVQVENEYGSYGDDAGYLAWLAATLSGHGITELMFTADGPTDLMLDGGTVPGVLTAATFGSRPDRALKMLRARRHEPFVCAEFWNGWFDHWGESHHTRDASDVARDVARLLELDGHVSLYMAHGGTNVGLWAGANHDGSRLQPTVTSYDSDAPIAEDGTLTPKFYALRDVFAASGRPGAGRTSAASADAGSPGAVPPAPDHLPGRSIETLRARPLLPFLRQLGEPVAAAGPLTMEQLGQASGLVLYTARPVLPDGECRISVLGLHDRTTVYIDGTPAGVLEREHAHAGLAVRGSGRAVELELLVENLGRINYGPRLGEHKGIVGDVLVDRRIVHGWLSRPLEIDEFDVDRVWAQAAGAPVGPGAAGDPGDGLAVETHGGSGAMARASFHVSDVADTFLALPGWTKGFVWINDMLLGRYWDRGPQRTLYVPGPLLRPGPNTVTVLELHAPGTVLELREEADLGETEEYIEVL